MRKKQMLSIMLCLLMALTITACGSKKQKTTTEITTEKTEAKTTQATEKTQATTATTESKSTEKSSEASTNESSNAMPVLEGIDFNAIPDLINNLIAFDDATKEEKENGYIVTAFSKDEKYYYAIDTNENLKIGCATFCVLEGDDTDNFLSTCATLAYTSSSPDDAKQWVQKNIGTTTSKTFGNALFELSVKDSGPVLKISADGYNDYIEQ